MCKLLVYNASSHNHDSVELPTFASKSFLPIPQPSLSRWTKASSRRSRIFSSPWGRERNTSSSRTGTRTSPSASAWR
ncbi:TPA: hypothetical protein N0F65_009873 [Lagenidium giganteum]|uniref:Uncharacterized protein n=1 Tax=Lagenidium giganteum TaxID=4803 RepID=A0AAV2YW46_9STRA|nr:TPA: hypothetical protein N0F65_009873 [Lagenidium giganteum]